MRPEKSLIVNILNYGFGGLILSFSLLLILAELTEQEVDYEGVVFWFGFLVVGIYLIWSSIYRYYGGLQTVIGLLFIGLSVFGVVKDFQEIQRLDGVAISFCVILFSVGAAFCFWGFQRNSKCITS